MTPVKKRVIFRMGCFAEPSIRVHYDTPHIGAAGGLEEGSNIKDFAFKGNSFKVVLPK